MKTTIIEELAENSNNTGGRRNFLRKLSLATAGTAAVLGSTPRVKAADEPPTATDVFVLNFALNLEYLEAEYYLRATTGEGLETAGVDVDGTNGDKGYSVFVKKNPKVKFKTPAFEDYANEIASDEMHHVRFIREALEANGANAVRRPQIDLKNSFYALGSLIGVPNFDPFANEVNFLLGAFIFEDVGVTAFKGASPLITNKVILEAAAGILGVEAYHAGIIRTLLSAQPTAVQKLANAISSVRQSLDNSDVDMEAKLLVGGKSGLIPTDGNSIVFSRSVRQVQNIVYGGINKTQGLFYPIGMSENAT